MVQNLLRNQTVDGLNELQSLNGLLFPDEINRYVDEEERHDIKILTKDSHQPLQTMSSGEQKGSPELFASTESRIHDFGEPL